MYVFRGARHSSHIRNFLTTIFMKRGGGMKGPIAIKNDSERIIMSSFPEDTEVDFATAALYLTGLQTVVATVVTASVSVMCCALLPETAVSAIRTLVLSSAAGGLLVRKPLRLGKVRGITLIFNSLRPCVAIYIVALVLEQLVHSCARDAATPSWRRFVFHSMVVLQMAAGFARARWPLQQTDVPFLVTATSLAVISLLPPPAVVLAGPLCASPTFGMAAERIVRAFVFALLYSIFVYASAPTTQASCDALVCIMRASSSSCWILGCNIYLLPFAALQGGLVIWVRIGLEEGDPLFGLQPMSGSYSPIGKDHAIEIVVAGGNESASDGEQPDSSSEMTPKEISLNGDSITATAAAAALAASSIETSEENASAATSVNFGDNMVVPNFSALGARKLTEIGKATMASCQLSNEQIAEIASRM